MIDVDSVLTNLKENGFYQVSQYIVSSLSMLTVTFSLLKIVFIGFVPKLTCAALNTSQLYSYGYVDNETKVVYEECQIQIFGLNDSSENQTLSCINGFDYSGMKDRSFVSQWDLVCDKAGLAELTQTLYSVGGLLGGLSISYLSDTRGRRPILLICTFLMMVSTVASAFSPNYYMFAAFRLMEGIFIQGLSIPAYTMMLELFPASNRTLMAGMGGIIWGLCVVPLAPIAYLFRNYSWKVVSLALATVQTWAFFQYWYLDESLRWLLSNGDMERSKKIIKRAARVNRVNFDTVWESCIENNMCDDNNENTTVTEKIIIAKEVKAEGFLTVFKDSLARKITLIICTNGLMNGLTYNGLYLMSPSLAGDRYMNFFLASITEIVANVCMALMLLRQQRRTTMAFFQVLSGISLLLAVTVTYLGDGSQSYLIANTIFSMMGMFGISASCCVIWLYTPELYPTNLRNIGLGFLTVSGNIGNMISPFSRLLMVYIPWLPGTIFSGGLFASTLLLALLPETKGVQMPTVMNDIKAWKTEQKRQRLIEKKEKMKNGKEKDIMEYEISIMAKDA